MRGPFETARQYIKSGRQFYELEQAICVREKQSKAAEVRKLLEEFHPDDKQKKHLLNLAKKRGDFNVSLLLIEKWYPNSIEGNPLNLSKEQIFQVIGL